MDFDNLVLKKKFVNENIDKLDKNVLLNYSSNFDIDFAHNSTAIEGNTLSLMETKMLIEDNLTSEGKDLREIYEVVNHDKAWNYVKRCVKEKKELSEDIVKELHNILMNNIMIGGIYRTVDVMITGAKHNPPSPNEAFQELKSFYNSLYSKELNLLELAAYGHAEFVRIHPFVDGNGRTSRMIMNYILLENGFLPISIKKEDRLKYYEALDEYAVSKDLSQFVKIIYELENEQFDFYIKAINDYLKN